MTDDLHIFPFCRQSYLAGLIDAAEIIGEYRKEWPAAGAVEVEAAVRARHATLEREEAA